MEILRDSQSAIDILSLNWKDTSYRDVTKDIKKCMPSLQNKGTCEQVDWTPGHSSIPGNDVADAAQEVSSFTEDMIMVSEADVKLASQNYMYIRSL